MGGQRRIDLLPECNLNGAPLEMFADQCCKHCINPECTRSTFGGSKFDQRTSTWLSRLFTEVPKLAPNDPRFQSIAGQKFLSIDVGRTPEVTSDWMDPRDIATSQPSPPPPFIAPEPPPPAVVADQPAEPAPTPPPQAVQPAAQPRKPIPRHMVLANAPSQDGKVLQPSSPSTVQKDPWAGPVGPVGPSTSADPNASVVKPGATVKLGGSGV